MRRKVTDYLLYRWRYIAGYGIIGLGVVALLIISGLFIPGGLSQAEMQSAVTSYQLSFSSFNPSMVIQLPYHLLQQLSIELFGLSNISIKLPSLLLSIGSAVGMLFLLRAWFRPNIAILTTILVITTGQFLFVAQSGTASIIYIFWSVWLLVAALMVSRRAKHLGIWKIVLFAVAALSLYTPLSIYILAALASAAILHPHLRYLIRRMLKARAKVAVAAGFALLLIAPLIYAIYKQPDLALTLLGIPDTWPNLLASASQLTGQYLDFLSPSSGDIMKPVYGLGPLLLIVLGIIRLVTTNYTARSYIITAWTLLLVPVLLINPNYITITFVPAMLLMAMGVNALLSSWYQLFPKNPYARIVGLIPLTILISGMVLSGVGRYMYGYTYDPNTAGHFSKDLRLLNKHLAASPDTDVTLVVTPKEQAFFTVVADTHDKIIVMTAPPSTQATPQMIITHDIHEQAPPKATPTQIITDGSSAHADRFYVYTATKQ